MNVKLRVLLIIGLVMTLVTTIYVAGHMAIHQRINRETYSDNYCEKAWFLYVPVVKMPYRPEDAEMKLEGLSLIAMSVEIATGEFDNYTIIERDGQFYLYLVERGLNKYVAWEPRQITSWEPETLKK